MIKQFDNGLKVGNIITTSYSGYFRITRIEKAIWNEGSTDPTRPEQEVWSRIYFKMFANSKGRPINGKQENWCSADQCKLAKDTFDQKINDLIKLRDSVKNISLGLFGEW